MVHKILNLVLSHMFGTRISRVCTVLSVLYMNYKRIYSSSLNFHLLRVFLVRLILLPLFSKHSSFLEIIRTVLLHLNLSHRGKQLCLGFLYPLYPRDHLELRSQLPAPPGAGTNRAENIENSSQFILQINYIKNRIKSGK